MYVSCKGGSASAYESRTPPPLDALWRPRRSQLRRFATTGAHRRDPAQKLLLAAEKIFARDGFEAARLEDIASLAGYTRGAFYANFQSKEDIFFALLEQWVGQRIAEVNALLARQESSRKALARAARTLRANYRGSPPRAALARIQALRHAASGSARATAHAPAPPSRLRTAISCAASLA